MPPNSGSEKTQGLEIWPDCLSNLLSLNVSSRINNYLSLRPRSSTWIEYMIDR